MALEKASSTHHDDKYHTHLWDSFNGAHYEFATIGTSY